ncbi:hypothetical protein Rhopal_004834-T1 [Rhodotorula paludigena]|uniref:Protein kinase domain-containing protein n=1 Tax=Rhodotorula paludigena TaxID=86838 RepID=A0AAV5GQL8_9BASI|nr:hypothetical protein Rhopal_004834-T1 [Rhodotorula paludigena]
MSPALTSRLPPILTAAAPAFPAGALAGAKSSSPAPLHARASAHPALRQPPAEIAGLGIRGAEAAAAGGAEGRGVRVGSEALVSPSGLTTPLPEYGMASAASPVASTSSAHFPHSASPPVSQHPPAAPYTREFPPPLAPRHWTVLKEVGDGSFGTVWLADWHSPLNLPSGTQLPGPSSRPEYKGKQLVAIKRMKKAFEGGWDECLKLKELKSLRQIPMHPNIIPLYDAFLLPTTRELYFVFECMEGNLYQLTKSRKGRPLASGLTASIFYQITAGLHHIHSHGYFHRDMKPENLLITTTGLADYPCSSLFALPGSPPEKDVIVVVKLADFGLARETASRPPYTEYVSTRWYRAPEVLLRSRDYSVPVDMWALGTILVEIVTLKPLFPGDSEVDQVYKICEVLGDPGTDYGTDEHGRQRGGGVWARGVKMAKDVGFAFPKVPPRNFASLFDQNVVPIQLIECIADLLRYEPRARLTTQQCLDHAYFRDVAFRFTPRAPAQTHVQQLPTPATSLTSTTSYSSTHGPSSLSLAASALSSSSKPASLASPRSIPPSHSHAPGAAPSFKLPFTSDPNAAALPSPDHFAQHRSHRNFSISSGVSGTSGLSGYQIHVQPAAASPQPHATNGAAAGPSDRASIMSLPSPAPGTGQWNGHDASWANGAGGSGLHPAAAMGGLGRRGSLAPSVAASTYYDGSVFEGVAPSRASSIMSFPTGASSTPQFPSLSPQQSRVDSLAGGVPIAGPSSNGAAEDAAMAGNRPASPTSSIYSQGQYPAAASPALSARSRWSLFSSGDPVRAGAGAAGSAPLAFATTGANPLKRSPSNASMSSFVSGSSHAGAASLSSLDPKKAKKEAERLAREQEKSARVAKEQAARERARAVIKKKTQLKEAADPLHTFAQQGKGGEGAEALGTQVLSSGASFVDKGKGRALPNDRMVQNRMPQIIEDTSRLHVSTPGYDPYGASGPGPSASAPSLAGMRYKARRRDEDDDVHSVSSNETGQSQQHWPFPIQPGRGRPFSISSKATSASDPERRVRSEAPEMDPLARVSSISSLPNPRGGIASAGLASGSMHRFPSYGHYTAPSTGHSSLDTNLISNMQGLATTSTTELHWPHGRQGAEFRSDSRQRLTSPHGAERYSPYVVPPMRSPGPTLPPIQSFDVPPQSTNPLLRQHTAGGASIASFRSTPATMPSYFVQQPSGVDAGKGGEAVSGTTYLLPYLPAMDADPPESGMSPVSATFPYPSPSLSATGAAEHTPHQYTPG